MQTSPAFVAPLEEVTGKRSDMAIHQAADTNADTPDMGNLRELIRFIRPKPDELRWQDTPWQTDLRDACRRSTETGKPIFLWAMNGNPLGCT